jgi:hypothetical protein
MNDKLEMMWKEVVVVYLNLLSIILEKLRKTFEVLCQIPSEHLTNTRQ